MPRYGISILLAIGALFFLIFPATLLECDAVIYSSAGLAGDVIQNTDAGHLAWGFLELGAAGIPGSHPIGILRWFSLVAALITVYLFHRLLLEMGAGPRVALAFAGLLLFSYSFWHFALQAEPHLPSTVFLMGFLLTSARYFQAPSTGRAALSALWLGLATLLHQTSILMIPAFVVAALLRGPDRVTWRRHAPAFASMYFLSAIVPYLLVGFFIRDLRTVAEFKAWIMGISTWGGWGYFTATTPVKSLIGLLRSLLGSHYLLGLEPVMEFADRLFPAASWGDELLLARQVPTWLALLLGLVQLGVMVGLAALLVQVVKRLGALWRSRRSITAFLLVWLGIYGGFIMWWAPERAEFWIGVILPLMALGALALGDEVPDGRWARKGLPMLVVGFLLVNLLGSIRPQAAPGIEEETRLILEIDAATEPGDTILSSCAFRGRAAKYVYSLNKMNLQGPRLFLASIASPAAETGHGPRQSGPNLVAGMTPLEAVGTAMEMAEGRGHSVFLIPQPLWLEEARAAEYNGTVQAILERWDHRDHKELTDGRTLVELLPRPRKPAD